MLELSDVVILDDGVEHGRVHMDRSIPVRFTLGGEGICCGHDNGAPVSAAWSDELRYINTIHRAMIDVSGREQRGRVRGGLGRAVSTRNAESRINRRDREPTDFR